MQSRLKARIGGRFFPLRWLLHPGADTPDEVRAYLLGQLLSSPMAIIMGSINSLLVSLVAVLRSDGHAFSLFMALECLMLLLRLAVIRHVRRVSRAGEVPAVDLPVLCSVLWCALQGSLACVIMQSGDAVGMVLAATLIMGIVGPICARNYPAPRLALLLVCLCDLPFKAGAALSGDPWLLILLLMTPPFLLGAMQVVLTFQKTLLSTLRAEARNNYLANHDVLTGLLNRQGLDAAIAGLWEKGAATAILGADLDGFKQANDQFGHTAGDKLLQAVGVKLAANIGPDDLVARIGGDEFLIVLKNPQPDGVCAVADRLIRSVAANPFMIDGQQIAVGMSVGYACYPDDAAGLEELKLRADHALYAAKRSGKGIGLRYAPSMSLMPIVASARR